MDPRAAATAEKAKAATQLVTEEALGEQEKFDVQNKKESEQKPVMQEIVPEAPEEQEVTDINNLLIERRGDTGESLSRNRRHQVAWRTRNYDQLAVTCFEKPTYEESFAKAVPPKQKNAWRLKIKNCIKAHAPFSCLECDGLIFSSRLVEKPKHNIKATGGTGRN
ncbi:hypothetical protein B0H19DRAFT_1080565 [Mycena capillaripes]|nr:hypothetical protein B0H19DRAFT_1080565 [Mycena capillaripes]